MATAALINPEIKIIPLADADLAGLENLFDEEWRRVARTAEVGLQGANVDT